MENEVYALNLLQALTPNLDAWEYTGQCNDAGKNSRSQCACGHAIRYEYIIKNTIDGRTNKLGSTCIEHTNQINSKLYKSLLVAVEKRKEEEKKKKEMLLHKEVAILKEELITKINEINNIYKKYRDDNKFVPYIIYTANIKTEPRKEYKTIKGLINWYKKRIKETNFILQNYNN